MTIAGSAIVFVTATILECWAPYSLRRYRVDIEPGESPLQRRSRFWQLNVWSRDNYDDRSKRLLPYVAILIAFQIRSGITLAGFIARAE